MAAIRLIAALGNIGRQYASTRHNAGFWFADKLAAQHGTAFNSESRFFGDVTRIATGGRQIWLIKPATLMNLSGKAVSALAGFYKIPTEEILVVHDELDLLPGQARLKLGGGVAGHNGLKDIRARCGGASFWRLRLGIGHPRDLGLSQRVADFVLKPPSAEHRELIDRSIDAALDTVADLAAGQFESAMLNLHTQAGKPPGRSD